MIVNGRITTPYNLIYDDKAYYPYMPLPNNYLKV